METTTICNESRAGALKLLEEAVKQKTRGILKRTSTCVLALIGVSGLTILELGLIVPVSIIALTTAAQPPPQEDFRRVQHSRSIVGLVVNDSQGEKIGKVKDLALDMENRRLVEVIVSSGGFLGFGQRTVAVPPGAFLFEQTGQVLRLNVNKEKFVAAPDFALSKWEEHCQSRRVAEVYRYYNQEPYFAADGQGSASGKTDTEPLGYVQRSSELLGLPVNNLQNEWLGDVNAFLLAPLGSRGGITHVIVKAPGFSHTKSVIPASMFRYNAKRDALCLDLSKQAFKNEPRFQWTYGSGSPFQWGYRDTPASYGDRNDFFRQETYSNTKVATNDNVNTRQNVQEGTANTYIPLVQGTRFSDVDLTYRIYTAMRADASLSQNAQNVEVGTLNGRITLRGHVNSEEGKRVIGKIAATAGSPENVSNCLEVRPTPATH
jgi:hypothetical protein